MRHSHQRKYWVIVASKDHVTSGSKQGIAQTCHGKPGSLRRMDKGDWVIFYSGKRTLGQSAKCQEFTAIGEVEDEHVYLAHLSEDFSPYRRKIKFCESMAVSILPLIEDLQFIKNKQHWGYPFRYGFFEINQHDFDLISDKML